jgi:hypothetical protein
MVWDEHQLTSHFPELRESNLSIFVLMSMF